MNAMKTTYRNATVFLIILGTAFGPQAFTANHFNGNNHFDGNNKNAMTKIDKAKPFEGFFIDPNPVDLILFSNQEKKNVEYKSTISIFTQYGCLVKQITLRRELDDDNLRFLSSGIYYLKINNNNGIEYRKILIN